MLRWQCRPANAPEIDCRVVSLKLACRGEVCVHMMKSFNAELEQTAGARDESINTRVSDAPQHMPTTQ